MEASGGYGRGGRPRVVPAAKSSAGLGIAEEGASQSDRRDRSIDE